MATVPCVGTVTLFISGGSIKLGVVLSPAYLLGLICTVLLTSAVSWKHLEQF